MKPRCALMRLTRFIPLKWGGDSSLVEALGGAAALQGGPSWGIRDGFRARKRAVIVASRFLLDGGG